MAQASDVDVRIDPDTVPALDGASEMLETGFRSTLHSGNAEAGGLAGEAPELLYDPQTAGGLLAGVPEAAADACIDALMAAGYVRATVIGIVEPMTGIAPAIRLGR